MMDNVETKSINEFGTSHGQRSLYFIHSLEGDAKSVYNEALVYQLCGRVCESTLAKALTTCMNQHQILRCAYKSDESGTIKTIVHNSCEFPFDMENVDVDSDLEEMITSFIRQPFDLHRPPLIRAKLYKISEDEAKLVIVAHHSITDGNSFGVLIKQLSQTYNNVKASSLPSDIAQYSDFISRENAKFGTDPYNSKVEKLANGLKGYSGMNFMSTLNSSETSDIYHGDRVYFDLPENTVQQLKMIARDNKASLFHILFSIYSILLNKYTRADDIVIGVPFLNRDTEVERDTIGYFVNTLPVRVSNVSENSYPELVKLVKKAVLSCLGKQEVVFEDIAKQLHLSRKPYGQHPLIQTLFVLGNTENLQLDFDGVESTLLNQFHSHTAKFDISLFMLEDANKSIRGYFEYRTCLFDQATMKNFSDCFIRLIQNILDDSTKSTSDYSLHTSESLSLMKKELFTAVLDKPVDTSLVKLFDETVKKYPNNIAVVGDDGKLTYAQLSSKVSHLAQYIRRYYQASYNKPVQGNTLIAVCTDRNIDMIIAILSVLKAGAAYVPIDPKYPQERINYIIEHSQSALLLTHRQQQNKIHEFNTQNVIYLDDIDYSEHVDDADDDYTIIPTDTAYVLYTSGSTGRPKGVSVSHENVICLFRGLERQFSLTESDVVSLFHTYCFDISVWEIWAAFMYGARLIVLPYETTRDPEKLYNSIKEENVSVFTQTASAFQLFINEDLKHADKLENLRYVAFVGESLKVSILKPWAKKYGTHQPYLANMYGITETTVYTNYKFVHQADIDKGRDNIGWPLEEFSMCILDENNQWCPIGIVGEICIGGRGLSKGYLHREDLTNERFINDPYAKFLDLPENTKLYRTGDLGRWVEDGSIEYLGRKDFQIKLRGFRIELGEIEAALGSFGGVSHTAVILKGEGISAYLAAYYTVEPNVTIDTNALQTHMSSFLPEYMMPSTFTEIDAFPMTINGKIDRNVLEQYKDTISGSTNVIPLENEFEYAIAAVWADMLKIDMSCIGRESSFFDLGGNSLLLINMLNNINRLSDVKITVSQFISTPTIARIVSVLNNDAQLSIDNQNFVQRLKSDIVLDEEIRPAPSQSGQSNVFANVLLTGATGFIGAHLLAELMNNTHANIYCLVRAEDKLSLIERIVSKLKAYRLSDCIDLSRLSVIQGDISKPNLGLSIEDHNYLKNTIDTIFHVGAHVHHIYDYQTLYNANVNSVVELLRMSTEGTQKSFHFISTLASQYISPIEYLAKPELDEFSLYLNKNGYLVSKWVSEQLVVEANSRGIQAHIYRPGNVIAGANGVYEPYDNHTLLRLKGMLQMKCAYFDPNESLEMMPVDALANAILSLAKAPFAIDYNLQNANSILWRDYILKAKKYGYEVEIINHMDEWNRLIDGITEENALYKFKHLYKYGDKANVTLPTLNPTYHIQVPDYSELIEMQLRSLCAINFLSTPQSLSKAYDSEEAVC